MLNSYPVIVSAETQRVEVSIKGGVGYVPIRFEGLDAPTGYALFQIKDGKEHQLDQSVHGNDFWQADYDASTQSYRLTYNLPLDGLAESSWVLRRIAQQAAEVAAPVKSQPKPDSSKVHQAN